MASIATARYLKAILLCLVLIPGCRSLQIAESQLQADGDEVKLKKPKHAQGAFDREAEFPNYFVSLNDFPAELNAFLRKLFGNIEVIDYQAYLKTKTITYVNLFEELQTAATAVNPNAEVAPAAGLIRNGIGLFYSQLYDLAIRGESYRGVDKLPIFKRKISMTDIRSVTRDLDIFVIGAKESFGDVESALTKVLEKRFGYLDGKSLEIFRGQIDIQYYETATRLASDQGGVSIDWLAYSLKQNKVLLPERDPAVLTRLAEQAGLMYFAPKPGETLREPIKQTMRGAKVLGELVMAHYIDDQRFRQELDVAIAEVHKHGRLSAAAATALRKSRQSCRLGCGNNRFYRGGKDSVEAKILIIVKAHGLENSLPLIPEYTPHLVRPPEVQNAEFPQEIAGAQISDADFRRRLRDGTLFHGTPDPANFIRIERAGYVISGGVLGQGTSVFDSGLYTSSDRRETLTYSEGVVPVSNKLRADLKLRVLDFSKLSKLPVFPKLQAAADKHGVDINTYLARTYDLDIIVRSTELVQNTAIFDGTEFSSRQALKHFTGVYQDKTRSIATRLEALEVVRGLASALDPTVFVTLPGVKAFVEENIQDWRRRGNVPLSDDGVLSTELIAVIERFDLLADIYGIVGKDRLAAHLVVTYFAIGGTDAREFSYGRLVDRFVKLSSLAWVHSPRSKSQDMLAYAKTSKVFTDSLHRYMLESLGQLIRANRSEDILRLLGQLGAISKVPKAEVLKSLVNEFFRQPPAERSILYDPLANLIFDTAVSEREMSKQTREAITDWFTHASLTAEERAVVASFLESPSDRKADPGPIVRAIASLKPEDSTKTYERVIEGVLQTEELRHKLRRGVRLGQRPRSPQEAILEAPQAEEFAALVKKIVLVADGKNGEIFGRLIWSHSLRAGFSTQNLKDLVPLLSANCSQPRNTL